MSLAAHGANARERRGRQPVERQGAQPHLFRRPRAHALRAARGRMLREGAARHRRARCVLARRTGRARVLARTPARVRLSRVSPIFRSTSSTTTAHFHHERRGTTMNRARITARRTALALALAVVGASASAAELTVVNFGGANGDAQKAAFNQPFEKATGNKVTAVEYNGEQAKVKAMVEAKHVNWDVVEVESGDLNRGCDEGLYEARLVEDREEIRPDSGSAAGVRRRLLRVVDGALVQRGQAEIGADRLGRFLEREEIPRQARHAQGRALQPRIRADGRRRRAEGRVQGARHEGRTARSRSSTS